MSKRSSAKYKLDRRMGENVFGRPKSPVNRREYGPGQHGQRRKGKLSDFGIQLRAKQKLKGYYGDVTEKQFSRTFQEASRMKGDTSQNLIGLLERRLDMVVYRAKFGADDLGRAPAGQSRPRPGQRQEAQHRLGAGRRRRRRRARHQGAEMALVIEAQGLAERDIPICRARRHHQGHLQSRPDARRGALSGPHGAEPGRRVLLALMTSRPGPRGVTPAKAGSSYHHQPGRGRLRLPGLVRRCRQRPLAGPGARCQGARARH